VGFCGCAGELNAPAGFGAEELKTPAGGAGVRAGVLAWVVGWCVVGGLTGAAFALGRSRGEPARCRRSRGLAVWFLAWLVGWCVVGGLTGAAFALGRSRGRAGKMPAVPGVGRGFFGAVGEVVCGWGSNGSGFCAWAQPWQSRQDAPPGSGPGGWPCGFWRGWWGGVWLGV
jgi:hypothetical protein